jgi:hypothetical protein
MKRGINIKKRQKAMDMFLRDMMGALPLEDKNQV